MYHSDFQSFNQLMQDLCVAFNRPHTDDLVRVFWDALKSHPLQRVRAKSAAYQVIGKKFPTPADLRPSDEERKTKSGAKEDTIPEIMREWVVKNHADSLTFTQMRSPWTWLHAGNVYSGEGFAITGVVVPADGDSPALRVMVRDMQLGNAA